jgi:hypothetical protein
MFQHINVTGLSYVIPCVQKTETPIGVSDDSNENEEDRHKASDAKDAKRKENAKLVILSFLSAQRRVGILRLSKCLDLLMCCVQVRAKMNKRLKMTS